MKTKTTKKANPDDELLTTSAAAREQGVTPAIIKKLRRRGWLPIAMTAGQVHLYRRGDVVEARARQVTNGRPPKAPAKGNPRRRRRAA